MRRWGVVLAIGAAGCKQLFALEDPTLAGFDADVIVDAPPTCTNTVECVSPTPYCELSSKYCVECLDSAHCPLDTRVCHPDTFSCVDCVRHADCESQVCLPDGQCAESDDVAYVSPAGSDASTCTVMSPCQTIATGLGTGRAYVKLDGAFIEKVSIQSARTVTLVGGPGTTLAHTGPGRVIELSTNVIVTIDELTVIGNADRAIEVRSNSTLRLQDSIVRGCTGDKPAVEIRTSSRLIAARVEIHSNAGGGISVDSSSFFDITNSFIYRNGSDNSDIGGVAVESSVATNRFEHNTVVDNRARLNSNAAGGVACVGETTSIPNNLIVRNYIGGSSLTTNANTLTTTAHCNDVASVIDTNAGAYLFAGGEGAGPWDYHIRTGSQAIDIGAASSILDDFDGELRPQGSKPDVGADEFKP